VAGAEAYLHAKFHLDPSNRLATVHQLHRQDRTGQTGQQSDGIGRTVLQTVAQKRLESEKYVVSIWTRKPCCRRALPRDAGHLHRKLSPNPQATQRILNRNNTKTISKHGKL